jgi:drug/metabolite transporter superfamily protein YnfA
MTSRSAFLWLVMESHPSTMMTTTTVVVQAMRKMMMMSNVLPREMLAYVTVFIITSTVWEVTTTSKVITRTAMMILLPR